MDKVNVSYRVDERLTIRGGYNREKKKKKDGVLYVPVMECFMLQGWSVLCLQGWSDLCCKDGVLYVARMECFV